MSWERGPVKIPRVRVGPRITRRLVGKTGRAGVLLRVRATVERTDATGAVTFLASRGACKVGAANADRTNATAAGRRVRVYLGYFLCLSSRDLCLSNRGWCLRNRGHFLSNRGHWPGNWGLFLSNRGLTHLFLGGRFLRIRRRLWCAAIPRQFSRRRFQVTRCFGGRLSLGGWIQFDLFCAWRL